MLAEKYLEWFQEGAQTFRLLMEGVGRADVFPTDENWYPCPICFTFFTVEELLDTENGLLSREHVPPERLGGDYLVLTCRRCNNEQGSAFDADAAEEERLRQFFSGQSGRAERSTFTVGDIATNVNVHWTGNGLLIIGDPLINDPKNTIATEDHMKAFSAARSTDFRFTITPRLRFSPNHARVSWIRSAYLAAFAVFGWRYVLQASFVQIRQQLLNPMTVDLPTLSMFDPDADPNRREVWLVKSPAEYRSVFVAIGQHGVFLPQPDDPRSLTDVSVSIGATTSERVTYSFSGDRYGWPQGPSHLMDPESTSV